MQIFQPAGRQTSTSKSGFGWGWWEHHMIFLAAGVPTVTQEPSALTTPFSSAILPPLLFCNNVCNKSQRKKPSLCEINATLRGTELQFHQHVSSLDDYLIHEFDHRSPLIHF